MKIKKNINLEVIEEDIIEKINMNFYNLCLNEGNIEIIKKYYKENKGKINIHKNNNKLFSDMCYLNISLNIIKFVYNETKYEDWIFNIEHLNDIFLNEDMICFLARYGYLTIGKYIYEKDYKKIDLYQKNNEPIVLACQENKYEFAQWLYSLEPKMDIFNDNIIIRNACYYKHIEIIEWYSIILSESNKSKLYSRNK